MLEREEGDERVLQTGRGLASCRNRPQKNLLIRIPLVLCLHNFRRMHINTAFPSEPTTTEEEHGTFGYRGNIPEGKAFIQNVVYHCVLFINACETDENQRTA